MKQLLQNLGIKPLKTADFKPLDKVEIDKIETFLATKLPEDYRLFLCTYGDADFEECVAYPTTGGGIYLGFFYGKNLLSIIIENQERLPNLVFPINNDGGDNLICISVRQHDFGHIYFQNHNFAEILTFVSASFTDFIFGLEIE